MKKLLLVIATVTTTLGTWALFSAMFYNWSLSKLQDSFCADPVEAIVIEAFGLLFCYALFGYRVGYTIWDSEWYD